MSRTVALCAVLLAGCQLTTSPTDGGPPQPSMVSERLPAAEIWLALARAVEAKSITSTTQLARTVLVLVRNDELSTDSATAFDQAFPELTRTNRILDQDDVQTLKGLK